MRSGNNEYRDGDEAAISTQTSRRARLATFEAQKSSRADTAPRVAKTEGDVCIVPGLDGAARRDERDRPI